MTNQPERLPSLPILYGHPYERGTTEVAIQRRVTDGQPVVVATFGNRFSETVIPMTREAARDLRNQLDAALHQSEPYLHEAIRDRLDESLGGAR